MFFFQAKENPTKRDNRCGLTQTVKGCKRESLSFSPCADMHHGEGHWNGSRAAPDGPLGSHSSRGDNICDIKQIWLTWTQQLHMQNFCMPCTYSPIYLHFFPLSLKNHPFGTWKTSLEVLFLCPCWIIASSITQSFYLDFYLVGWPQGEKKIVKVPQKRRVMDVNFWAKYIDICSFLTPREKRREVF